jgi:hypothetical protein
LGIGSPQEWSGGARGVELIAGGQVIFFPLFFASFGSDRGAGIDKIFKGAIGTNHRTDIAALHDKGSGEAKFPLKIDEVLAEFGQCGDGGDGSVHFGQASMGAEVAFSLAESDFLAGDLRMEIYFFQKLLHTGAGAGVVTRFKSEKSKSTIHRSGIDVDIMKIVSHKAGDGALA